MGLDIKARYSTSESIVIGDLPQATGSLVCRTAFGLVIEARRDGDTWILGDLPTGTHVLEAWSREGHLLSEEITTVSARPGDDPVMAFATSFEPGKVDVVLAWLRALRCSVVQFYDWMERYSAPLSSNEDYSDPLGRRLSRSSLQRLVAGTQALGAVAQAYAPICAAEPDFASTHGDWLLYRSDSRPQHLGDLLQIMDPGNSAWQEHWLAGYKTAVRALGFNGLHLDTYGYPRRAMDKRDKPVLMERAYGAFIDRVRRGLPSATISFNQVNGVPPELALASQPSFRYAEVWPPNDGWRHLEALMTRSAGHHLWAGGALAIYPPVWRGGRDGAVRTVALTNAITTVLGAGLLVLGDDLGALCHPYYPDHEQLSRDEAEKILSWHRFGLRCRDLFRHGEDTSWYDVGDPNGAVYIEAPGFNVSPEPSGGTLFARIVRTGTTTTISCIDLTGSATGAWGEPAAKGRVGEACIRLLVTSARRCRAEVAVLGVGHGRFEKAQLVASDHLEGRAVELRLPIVEGWSVARFDESV